MNDMIKKNPEVKPSKFNLTSAGYSLLEVVVATAILGVGVTVLTGGNNFLTKKKVTLQDSVELQGYVDTIYSNIQSNIGAYQITYDSTAFQNAVSPQALAKLPIAWDSHNMMNAASCPKCVGKMGYIIEPVNNYRGLYKLTIRITHPSIPTFKDYVMLVVGN